MSGMEGHLMTGLNAYSTQLRMWGEGGKRRKMRESKTPLTQFCCPNLIQYTRKHRKDYTLNLTGRELPIRKYQIWKPGASGKSVFIHLETVKTPRGDWAARWSCDHRIRLSSFQPRYSYTIPTQFLLPISFNIIRRHKENFAILSFLYRGKNYKYCKDSDKQQLFHSPIHLPLCTLSWPVPLLLKYRISQVPGESSLLQAECWRSRLKKKQP